VANQEAHASTLMVLGRVVCDHPTIWPPDRLTNFLFAGGLLTGNSGYGGREVALNGTLLVFLLPLPIVALLALLCQP